MSALRQSFTIEYNYPIYFTSDLFQADNRLLVDSIRKSTEQEVAKLSFVIDKGVRDHHPALIRQIETYCKTHASLDLAIQPLVLEGGESCKNSMDPLMEVLKMVHEGGIDRHAYVVAIGGGAMLDMVGFAATIAHRSVRHIRIPTTVLSQNDSGVGVKNGINYFGKKNFLGTFAVPDMVINDVKFLTTLDARDWRAGMSEAVKVALLKDPGFYSWLEDNAPLLAKRDLDAMAYLIRRCAELHAEHISQGGDPFESGSSRPLDFGHWAAHKLEQITNYQVRHGEAVAIGIAMDVMYSAEIGHLDVVTAHRIIECFESLGFEVFHSALLNKDGSQLNRDLLAGLTEFREHLGGQLTIILLSDIGDPFEVHEMDTSKVEAAAIKLAQKNQIHAG